MVTLRVEDQVTAVQPGSRRLLVVDAVMDTFSVSGGFLGAIGLAIVFGILSAVIGTLLRRLTLPLVLMCAGLFEFVINALLLLVTAWLTDWLEIDRLRRPLLPRGRRRWRSAGL